MNQKETEIFLRKLLGAVDDIISENNDGERMAVALLIAPFHENGRVNYISNGQKEDMIEMMRGLLIRLETGNIDPPFDRGKNPINN